MLLGPTLRNLITTQQTITAQRYQRRGQLTYQQKREGNKRLLLESRLDRQSRDSPFRQTMKTPITTMKLQTPNLNSLQSQIRDLHLNLNLSHRLSRLQHRYHHSNHGRSKSKRYFQQPQHSKVPDNPEWPGNARYRQRQPPAVSETTTITVSHRNDAEQNQSSQKQNLPSEDAVVHQRMDQQNAQGAGRGRVRQNATRTKKNRYL